MNIDDREIRRRHIKNLEWLFLFLQTKFDDCSPGDLLKLKEKLFEFIYNRDVARLAFEQQSAFRSQLIGGLNSEVFCKMVANDDLRNLQRRLLSIFKPVMKDGIGGPTPMLQWTVGAVSFTLIPSPEIKSKPGTVIPDFSRFEQRIELLDSLNDFEHLSQKATIALADHLIGSQIAPNQILNCPECGRLFLAAIKPRKDRKRYCSVRCSQNSASRKHRQRIRENPEAHKKFRKKEGQRSNRRYRKKVLGTRH